ncbi:hypothetical protein [Saccharothrix lopnurensis]|uniref:Uncharacterized protein n=1 Tax=Saccharothrix lopnurensis TaxID=1670621 RepID=A0ABW1PAQ3_9PSEU
MNSPVVDSPVASSPVADSSVADSSVSVVDGSVVDGSVVDGSVVDGSVVDGSVVDGSATLRRVVAITCGLPPAAVPDAVVTALAESDRVPVCWYRVEELLAAAQAVVRAGPASPVTTAAPARVPRPNP